MNVESFDLIPQFDTQTGHGPKSDNFRRFLTNQPIDIRVSSWHNPIHIDSAADTSHSKWVILPYVFICSYEDLACECFLGLVPGTTISY